MKWKDVIDEKPSAELDNRILRQANAELLHHRQRAGTASLWRRRTLASGLALAALTFALLPRRFFRKPPADTVALQDAELLNNIGLLNQLEMFEDFEILEKWNGSDV